MSLIKESFIWVLTLPTLKLYYPNVRLVFFKLRNVLEEKTMFVEQAWVNNSTPTRYPTKTRQPAYNLSLNRWQI